MPFSYYTYGLCAICGASSFIHCDETNAKLNNVNDVISRCSQFFGPGVPVFFGCVVRVTFGFAVSTVCGCPLLVRFSTEQVANRVYPEGREKF